MENLHLLVLYCMQYITKVLEKKEKKKKRVECVTLRIVRGDTHSENKAMQSKYYTEKNVMTNSHLTA